MFRVWRNKPSSGGSGGVQALPPASKEITSATHGSSPPPLQGSCEAPTASSSLLPESLLSVEGKLVGPTPADHAAPSETK
ncbi:unnamed protein product [Sphagnum balticum]